MPPPSRDPITVALVDDYDVVVKGVANMLEPYRDRVVVAELDSTMPVKDTVDIVLYDSFAQPESDHEEIGVLVANPRARRVVVYTWNFHPDLDRAALGSTALTAICRRRCRPANWSPPWRRCTPARPSSASHRRGRAAPRAGLARPRRRAQRPRVGDPGADHPGQEQRRRRQTDLPEPQHGEVLHPHDLPQDRRRQPHPGGAVGGRPRLHPRPPPHRTLARRSLVGRPDPRRLCFTRLLDDSLAGC